MDELWKDVLWNQFGATIDMFGDALKACPEELWTEALWNDPLIGTKFSEFWYVSYHALFWLDLYLDGAVEGFQPPEPFDLNELDALGVLPKRRFNKEELLAYLGKSRHKCRKIIEGLTDEKLHQVFRFPWRKDGLSYAELLVDNLRHLQEHGAQLSMFIGQRAGLDAKWLGKARDDE
jgi:hypothetical protein